MKTFDNNILVLSIPCVWNRGHSRADRPSDQTSADLVSHAPAFCLVCFLEKTFECSISNVQRLSSYLFVLSYPTNAPSSEPLFDTYLQIARGVQRVPSTRIERTTNTPNSIPTNVSFSAPCIARMSLSPSFINGNPCALVPNGSLSLICRNHRAISPSMSTHRALSATSLTV